MLVVWFFAWLVCSISYWLGFPRQARWRGWPAGQLDPAPPNGCSCVEPLTNTDKYCQILKPVAMRVNPGGLLPSILHHFFCLRASTWPNSALLSSMFVHLARLGPHLAPTWPILAPTWPNLAPTWPNLVPTWTKLAPTWPNFGPNLVEHGPKIWPRWASRGVF